MVILGQDGFAATQMEDDLMITVDNARHGEAASMRHNRLTFPVRNVVADDCRPLSIKRCAYRHAPHAKYRCAAKFIFRKYRFMKSMPRIEIAHAAAKALIAILYIAQ